MTTDQILDAVGGADDALLAVCDTIPPAKLTVKKWLSVAACAAVCAAAVFAVLHEIRLPVQPDGSSLPADAVISEGETSARQQNEDQTERDPSGSVAEPETTAKHRTDIPAPPILNLPAQSDPAFYPDERSTSSGFDGRRGYYGDVETPRNGETVTSDGLWDQAPITSKYPTMVWNGQTYASRGKAQLNGKVQKQTLGTASLQGFDGNPSHKTTVQLYPITGVAQNAAVAVQFGEDTAYYAYVCQTYAPATLGQLTDDLSLTDNCTITGASGCGGDLAATVYSAPAASEVRKLLDRAAPLDTGNTLHPGTVLIRYSLPLLGQTSGSMELTADGYLLVYFCERELVYRVGSARAEAFIDYLNRSCDPKKLGEQTTAGHTVSPAEE